MHKLKQFCKSKFIVLSLCGLLALCLAAGSIAAYLTDADQAINTVTVGSNEIEIIEEFTPPDEVYPGDVIPKDVKVKNTGLSDCYVRVAAVFSDTGMSNFCTVDWNTTDWVYNENDGYWYYKKAISEGESTSSLFTTVTVSNSVNWDTYKNFDIFVYAESYQANGHDNYTDAWSKYHEDINDIYGPAVTVVYPTGTSSSAPLIVYNTSITATGLVFDSGTGVQSINVNGVAASVDPDGYWIADVPLSEGVNALVATATDKAGNETIWTEYVCYDTIAPTVVIDTLPSTTTDSVITVTGSVTDSSSGVKSLVINGTEVTVNDNGSWSTQVSLIAADNTISAVATDKSGNVRVEEVSVYYDSPTPLLVVSPPDVTYSGTYTVTGRVRNAKSAVTVTVNGEAVTVSADGSWAKEITLDGTSILVEAADSNGWSVTEAFTYTEFIVTADNRSKVGFTGSENEALKIPATFYDEEDDTWYKVVAIGTDSDTYGNGAFESQRNLTSVVIPDTVTTIGNYAFSYCYFINSVTIPNSVTKIGDYAFNNCNDLASVTIPNSVTSIGSYAFGSCYDLTSVVIPNSVTEIGKYAFYACDITSATIGSGITVLPDHLFYWCDMLTSVTFAEGSQLTTIGEAAFQHCTSLASITIPSTVTTIEFYAFKDCTTMTSFTIPASVTRLENHVFNGCTSLTSVAFENTTGWWVGDYSWSTSGTSIDVTNPTTAATYLTSTYLSYHWFRS